MRQTLATEGADALPALRLLLQAPQTILHRSLAGQRFVEVAFRKGRGKKKSIRCVSINLASGALIVALNWVNRIVYLKGRTL